MSICSAQNTLVTDRFTALRSTESTILHFSEPSIKNDKITMHIFVTELYVVQFLVQYLHGPWYV